MSNKESIIHSTPHKHTTRLAFIVFAVVAIYGMWGLNRSGGSFAFGFGETNLQYKVPESKEDLLAQMNSIMADDKMQPILHVLLMSKYHYYKLEPGEPNKELVNAIEDISAKDAKLSFSRSLRTMLAEYKGPFRKEEHTFRDFTQRSILDDINQLGDKNEVIRLLREAAYNDPSSPLYPPAETGQFVILDELEEGVIGVCSNNKIGGRQLSILSGEDPGMYYADYVRCIRTANENKLFVDSVEIEASFDSLFIGKSTAEKWFSDPTSSPFKVQLSRYLLQPKWNKKADSANDTLITKS